MKAISLWQPWASAIALGMKRNETRHWHSSYRGPLLIHAAKKKNKLPPDLIEVFGQDISDMPYGSIICRVNLVDCQLITLQNRPPEGTLERALGDYTPGRFMWLTDNHKTFDNPIPFRGSQGFFNVPDELIKDLS